MCYIDDEQAHAVMKVLSDALEKYIPDADYSLILSGPGPTVSIRKVFFVSNLRDAQLTKLLRGVADSIEIQSIIDVEDKGKEWKD